MKNSKNETQAKKLLIVNADDCGMTRGISDGIVQASHDGIVTSTSLMVHESASGYAAKLLRRESKISVGLHAVVSQPPNTLFSMSNVLGALELQLERFGKLMGRLPTHLDIHAATTPSKQELFAALAFAGKYGLPHRGGAERIHRFYGMIGTEPAYHRITQDALSKTLKKLSVGRNLLICHPGKTNRLLKDPYRTQRNRELTVLTSSYVRDLINTYHIELVPFDRR